jgi:hypothetical protein
VASGRCSLTRRCSGLAALAAELHIVRWPRKRRRILGGSRFAYATSSPRFWLSLSWNSVGRYCSARTLCGTRVRRQWAQSYRSFARRILINLVALSRLGRFASAKKHSRTGTLLNAKESLLGSRLSIRALQTLHQHRAQQTKVSLEHFFNSAKHRDLRSSSATLTALSLTLAQGSGFAPISCGWASAGSTYEPSRPLPPDCGAGSTSGSSPSGTLKFHTFGIAGANQ